MLMGGKLGMLFARAGHDVVFSYAHSEQKVKRLAREAQGNSRAGTPSEAARDANALLLAVHWSRVDDVLKQTGDVSGKIIVTCSLPMNTDNTDLVIAHTSSGAEALAKKVRRPRVVSAFGTVPSEVRFASSTRRGRLCDGRESVLVTGYERRPRSRRGAGARSHLCRTCPTAHRVRQAQGIPEDLYVPHMAEFRSHMNRENGGRSSVAAIHPGL
jgi:predicted dinucleotide-binding enzyme